MKAGIAVIALSLLVAGTPASAQQSKTAAKPSTAKSPSAPGVAAKNPAPKQTVSHEPQAHEPQAHGADAPAALADIPDAQRLAIADLIWLGGFDGLSAQECNGHAADAIRAFQRRSGSKDTGVLSDQDRASLAQAAAAREAAVGWRLIDDTATGALLGVPQKIVPRASSTRTGSRWTSAQGQIQIETFRMHDASLSALFDQEKKTAQRYVGYSALNQNSFVMTGEQKLKYFVERAQSNGGEIRGVTISYDQATEGTIAAVAVAVADSFAGFPDVTGSVPARQRGVQYGTALVVDSRGDLIAPEDVTEDCQAISVPGFGHADRVAEDKADGLALLRLYGARDLVPATLDGATGTPAAVTLYGIADPLAQGGGAAVSSAAAQVSAQGFDPAPKPGFSGAAALDAQGHFAGIVELKSPLVAGPGVAPQATLIPASAVRTFLQVQGITPADGHAAMAQSIVRVICVRN